MFKLLLTFCLFTNLAHAQIISSATTLKRKTFTEIMPKKVVATYEKNIKELKELGFPKKALKVGDKVPEFKINLAGTEYPISSAYAKGSVVLKFYPNKDCKECLADLKKYNEMNDEFKKSGAQIVTMTSDSMETNMEFRKKEGIQFDVLSDPNLESIKQFDLVYEKESDFIKKMKSKGLNVDSFNNEFDSDEVALPATYLITKDGKIAFSYVGVDENKLVDPAIVLEATKKMQEIVK